MNDKSPMPFGKYKGDPLEDVPDDYLLWLLRQTWVATKYPDLWKYLIDNQDIFQPSDSFPDASIEDTY